MITDDFTAYAGKVHIVFDKKHKAEDLKALVSQTISGIAVSCVDAGTRLIGHIKCIAEVESGKYVACSVVKHDGEAMCRGELSDGSKSLTLVINVLIYGLDKEKVEEIVMKIAKDQATRHGGHLEVEDLEYHDHSHQCEAVHEHEHDHEGHEHQDH
jgi:hypothetical protein